MENIFNLTVREVTALNPKADENGNKYFQEVKYLVVPGHVLGIYEYPDQKEEDGPMSVIDLIGKVLIVKGTPQEVYSNLK